MCGVCGCGDARPARLEAAGAEALLVGPAPRVLQLQAQVLQANDQVAEHNRAAWMRRGVLALNLLAGPGAGKTSLLVATLQALRQAAAARAMAVVEGDQQTSLDAERIRACGVPALQINTGQGCHLDAAMLAAADRRLQLQARAGAPALLFIENVGNLVCPALWDLGEAAKVALLSVTEGEDKPLKYPDLFAAARLVLIHKTDLLPHLDFDLARCRAALQQVNPGVQVLELSSRSGAGLQAWLDWLLALDPARLAAERAAAQAARLRALLHATA